MPDAVVCLVLLPATGLRGLVFSGDHDLCVPHTGSEAWTRSLGRPVISPWQPWHIGKPKQVAGYAIEYAQHLTYATVKGAGHMVPQTRPAEAYAMFERFVSGQALTSHS
jgi:serine carboxypeptidase-like clade 1